MADAKAKICAAYERADHAVLANTGRSGDDGNATLLGLAANARIALFDSGEYLFRTLAQEPAAPAELATATKELANSYQELAVDYMAEASDWKIQLSRNAIETAGTKADQICK